jgi:hypothetical protein
MMLLSCAVVLALTIVSIWVLTYYRARLSYWIILLFVLTLSSAAIAFGTAGLLRHPIAFRTALTIVVAAYFAVLLYAFIAKWIVFAAWQYSEIIRQVGYRLVTRLSFEIAFLALPYVIASTYGFVRYTGMKIGKAITVSMTTFYGGLIVTMWLVAATRLHWLSS